MALIDLLAILPFFLAMFFSVDLRTLRLLRILRILKLSHYFSGFNIFVTVIRKELRSIMATLLVMMFLITIAASLMYTVENKAQPEYFGSIIQSYWWAVVTMTTVGYGDVIPLTPLGKLISMFIMLLGVGIVALPAGLLAARFGEELRERKKNLDVHIVQALADGKIDSNEYKSLLQLADKLELKPDDLKRSIKLNKKRQQTPEHGKECPHCHKAL
jgi:voltage-gated potassium channel